MLWVVVMYAFFTATVVRESKPTLETGINGAWLLGIVATQSVSVLGSPARAGHSRTGGRSCCSSPCACTCSAPCST